MLTPADLARLKELCAKATPGPWEARHHRVVRVEHEFQDGSALVACITETDKEMTAVPCDAAFIAEARTWLPKLVEEVERLRRVQSAALHYVEACSEGLPKEARDNYLDTFLDAIHAEPGGESQ